MMFRKIVSLLLAAALTASMTLCASAEDLSSGTPWIDSELDGAITEGMTFDVKDDFAAAVNSDWMVQAEYAQGMYFAGTTADVMLLVQDQLTDLVTGENPDGDPYLDQVQSLYGLYLDWDSRNAAGTSPLMPVLEKLEAIQSLDDLNAFLVLPGADRDYLTGPFTFGVTADLKDSTRYTLWVSSADLLLGDSAEYTEPTESGRTKKENMLELFRKVMKKAGYSDERTEEIITNAFTFETAAAPYIYTSDEVAAPDYTQKANNPFTRAELKELEGSLPIVECILANGVKDEDFTDVLLYNPGWLDAVKTLYTDENAAAMRDTMILHYVLSYTGELDEESWEWDRDCSNALSGITSTRTQEQYAVSYVQSVLKWPVARAYVSRYFTQEDKDRVYQMCQDIIAEYKKMLQEEDFLSEETIAYACEKLDAMQVFALYPDDDQWPDTSTLAFRSGAEGGTLWEAVTAIRAYSKAHSYALLGTVKDRTCWNENALPTSVNASNSLKSNSITIYAAICQGGIYHSDMSTEELYAGLGTIVGHEISHSFDGTGAQFDKTGSLSNWWTEEDYAGFQAKVQKMMDYYDTIVPWEGQHVHGSIVTGEATADIAGVKIMLRMAKSVDSFDYDKFFRSYAVLWREKITRAMELRLLSNEHPLSYLRINVTLAQQPEFLETYGIQEGDGMYIAPEDRIAIW